MDACFRIYLQIVGHALQVSGGVDVLNLHIVRHIQADGGVVENGAHACLNQFVCNALRGRGGDGEHCNFDIGGFDAFDHFVCILNCKLADICADLFLVVVEEDLKHLALKLISRK